MSARRSFLLTAFYLPTWRSLTGFSPNCGVNEETESDADDGDGLERLGRLGEGPCDGEVNTSQIALQWGSFGRGGETTYTVFCFFAPPEQRNDHSQTP